MTQESKKPYRLAMKESNLPQLLALSPMITVSQPGATTNSKRIWQKRKHTKKSYETFTLLSDIVQILCMHMQAVSGVFSG